MLTRTFVTGGSGFVGRHLIAALRACGVEVRALARSGTAAERVQRAGVIPVAGDLENQHALQQGMESCDVVFHLAAMKAMWGRFEEFVRVNVLAWPGRPSTFAAVRR